MPQYICGGDQSWLIYLALELGREKRWGDAIRILKRAESVFPGFWKIVDYGWHYLVMEAGLAGEVEAAIKCFEQTPKGFGTYMFVRSALISTFLDLVSWGKAVEWDKVEPALQYVLEIAPDLKRDVFHRYLRATSMATMDIKLHWAERFFVRASQLSDLEDGRELILTATEITKLALISNNAEYERRLGEQTFGLELSDGRRI